MKIKLPNVDKVHYCPGCHSVFNVYYGFGAADKKFHRLRRALLELLPLYCKKCKTLKLPLIFYIEEWE